MTNLYYTYTLKNQTKTTTITTTHEKTLIVFCIYYRLVYHIQCKKKNHFFFGFQKNWKRNIHRGMINLNTHKTKSPQVSDCCMVTEK